MKKIRALFLRSFVLTAALMFTALPVHAQEAVASAKNTGQFPREFQVRYRVDDGLKILGISFTNVDFAKVSVLLTLESADGNTALVRVQSFELSNFTIPALPVKVLRGNRTNTVMTPPVIMEQKAVQAAVSNMAPIEEIIPISDPAVFLLILLALLLLAVSGLLIYRVFFMKKKNRLTIDDRIDPYEEALKNLNRLKQAEWNEKNAKEIYLGIWEVVRRFLDRVFGFPALEMSTSEIVAHFRNASGGGLDEIQDIALHILKVCDRVKYAKYRPEKDQKDQILRDSFELVRRAREHLDSLKAVSGGPGENS